MKNIYLDSLYNCNDDLGVKMFGVRGWNRLKGSVAGVTDSMMNNPRAANRPISTDRRFDELFVSLFRPDVRAGAELLGGGWVERVEDCALGDIWDSASNVLNSNKVQTAADIFHNAANIVSYIPGYGKYVEGGRKGANFVANALNSFGFGTTGEQVQTAAKWGGVALLVGGGLAVWYFGFHKKKKGRR